MARVAAVLSVTAKSKPKLSRAERNDVMYNRLTDETGGSARPRVLRFFSALIASV